MVRNPSAHGGQVDIAEKFSANLRPLALERRRARNFWLYFFDRPPALSHSTLASQGINSRTRRPATRVSCPQLVKAAVEGRLPRGINIERLRDPDPDWAMQFKDLGLNPN